jgi:hypothetical protein
MPELSRYGAIEMALRSRFVLLALAVPGITLGCGGDASYDVRYAAAYTPPRTVSVFGVFRDGRMNPEAWDALGSRLSAPLGGASCEIAIGAKLTLEAPTLLSALDDTTRANGVTDAILGEFAPMAKADTILVFTIAGRPPQPLPDKPGTRATPASNRFSTGRRMRGNTGPQPSTPRADRNVFEISASLYSVKTKESVGVIGMSYEGQSVEDAFQKFAAKLSAELPGTRCAGWDLSGHVDEDKLRALGEH